MSDSFSDFRSFLERLEKELKGPEGILEENPDDLSHEALQEAKADAEKAETKRKELLNKQLEQDIAERKKYAKLLFWSVVVWLAAIIIIVILQGFSFLCFTLSDEVLITLIGSTTLNVIGLFLIVGKYLFPSGK